jgi:hypothetical protein
VNAFRTFARISPLSYETTGGLVDEEVFRSLIISGQMFEALPPSNVLEV